MRDTYATEPPHPGPRRKRTQGSVIEQMDAHLVEALRHLQDTQRDAEAAIEQARARAHAAGMEVIRALRCSREILTAEPMPARELRLITGDDGREVA